MEPLSQSALVTHVWKRSGCTHGMGLLLQEKNTKGPLRHLCGKPYCRESTSFLNLKKKIDQMVQTAEKLFALWVSTLGLQKERTLRYDLLKQSRLLRWSGKFSLHGWQLSFVTRELRRKIYYSQTKIYAELESCHQKSCLHSSALIVTVLRLGWKPNNMTWCTEPPPI